MLRRFRHRCALAGTAVVGTLLLAPAVQALEWELVEPQHATTTDSTPDLAPASGPIHSDRLAWELVIPGDEISPAVVAQEVEEAEALRNQALASVPEPTRLDHRRALPDQPWRGGLARHQPAGAQRLWQPLPGRAGGAVPGELQCHR
jgi:hypothetical protein